jgi:YYY domain-containing protein
MIAQSLNWYATLQLFALAGFPLAFVWLRHLPSRGYAAAKALGILLSGVLLWWGGITHLTHNTAGATLTVIAILLIGGISAMRRHKQDIRTWWQDNGAFVLVTELLFAIAFFAWTAVRAAQPQLETAGGEKWMEIAYLNAVLRSPSFPPHDPWLSGFAISYYYLGYLLMGMLTRLAALPASVAFNLCNASWFALAAVGGYGLVYDMLSMDSTRPSNNIPNGQRVVSALLGPLLMVVTGNGEGLMEILHARGLLPPSFWAWLDIRNLSEPPRPPFTWMPQRYLWWWQASRTLRDYTPWGDHQEVIDEFPAFSFILGDMHPHVLALPFVLLAVTLALNHYRAAHRANAQEKVTWGIGFRGLRHTIAENVRWDFLGTALILGALGFLNTWDFPIYWAVTVGAIVMGRWRAVKEGNTRDGHAAFAEGLRPRHISTVFDVLWGILPQAVALGMLSVLSYLPFWIGLRSQAGGILPNLFNATRAQQFAVMFAPLLVPVAGIVIGAAWRVSRGEKAHNNREGLSFKGRLVLWALGLIVGIAGVGLLLGLVAGYPQIMAVLKGKPVPGFDVPPEVFTSALWQRLLNPWVALILALGVGTAIAIITSRFPLSTRNGDRGFPLLLILIGLLLTLAPEFVFLKDIFWARMNTIFKFYFQAWVLWSLAGAWQIARWLTVVSGEVNAPSSSSTTGMTTPHHEETVAWLRLGAIVASIVLISMGLLYTILAVPTRAREHETPWTLDGMAWMADAEAYLYDWQAIQWLNAHISGRPVIVEAPADKHRAYVYEGRVSALTGLPTVLGWAGHERQWRGNYEEQALRESALDILFTTPDPTTARVVLETYNVRYIYIGLLEKGRYPAEGLAKFETMFPVVYSDDGVVIYEVTPATVSFSSR